MVLLAGPLLAADASPKAEIKSAAAALGSQSNYAWHSAVASPNGGGRFGGPTDGRTEKGGYTTLSMTRGDNTMQVVLQGTNGAIKTPENGWQTLAAAAQDNGEGGFSPVMFLARTMQNFKAPAVQASDLADQAKDLQPGTNGISGELTEEGAKALLTFRPPGNDGPTITNARGSVKFWVQDGKLVKYQFQVQGHVSFNDNDRDVDRTTTVEIKDVNSTKLEVSDDVKKILK